MVGTEKREEIKKKKTFKGLQKESNEEDFGTNL